jgi:hypothetical protein
MAFKLSAEVIKVPMKKSGVFQRQCCASAICQLRQAEKAALCQAHPYASLLIKRNNYCINCTQGTQTMICHALRTAVKSRSANLRAVSGQWLITQSARACA